MIKVSKRFIIICYLLFIILLKITCVKLFFIFPTFVVFNKRIVSMKLTVTENIYI